MKQAPTHFLGEGTALGLAPLEGGFQAQEAPTHQTTKTT